MKSMIKMSLLVTLYAAPVIAFCGVGCNAYEKYNRQEKNIVTQDKKLTIQVILGSTRQGRISDKIARAFLKDMGDNKQVQFEIVDLRDYNLPFLNDEVSPSKRTIITDPIIQRWSDKIKSADAFVIIFPEYNSGYPGVLKNALDLLYKEWNNKPVALVSYSGGELGGAHALAQLREVTLALEMRPIDIEIRIPSSWKAVNRRGSLDLAFVNRFHEVVGRLIDAQPAKN